MYYEGRKLQKCEDMDQITVSSPKPEQCAECVKAGDKWVYLRTCLICGDVGCCGSSKNKHAGQHYKETGHPLYHITESGGKIAYCYTHDHYVKF